MSWELLAEIDLLNEWQFTPVTDAEYFRVRSSFPGQFATIFRQAQTPTAPEFWGQQSLIVAPDFLIFRFEPPPFFDERRLAVKRANRNDSLTTLELEVYPMGLYNPANVTITPVTSSTATASTVAASTTSVTILASNSSRKGATIQNNGTGTLYLEMGPTATTTSYLAPVYPGGYFELPFGYIGQISGIWSSTGGSAFVREFT